MKEPAQPIPILAHPLERFHPFVPNFLQNFSILS